jgi:hypothetical protein
MYNKNAEMLNSRKQMYSHMTYLHFILSQVGMFADKACGEHRLVSQIMQGKTSIHH